MGLKIGGQVEKVNGKDLRYKDFVENYMVKNQPVVLTGLMDDWQACTDWVTQHHNQPNLHFFSTHFPNSKVQVAECGDTHHSTLEMTVSDFVHHWLHISHKQDNAKSPLYLKDWHFVKEYPEYVAYTTPLFFRDDWLNLYLNNYHMHTDPDTYQKKNEISCSDYRFVYMGAKGTWTPLHADVFRSYSWSANVCGKKQWHFLSPSQCSLVFDRNMRNSVYNIFDDVCEAKFPGFKKAVWVECTQEQNEIIFVPSGWYHQVHNVEDTISINHNWFNGYNLVWVWKLLLKDYNEAKGYIEDIREICDDFEGLCQRNLAANTGMNFSDFFIFLARFSLANLVNLYVNEKSIGKPLTQSSPKTHHLVLNLISMKKVALSMQSVGSENRNISLDTRCVLKEPLFWELCRDLGRTYQMIHEQGEQSSDKNEPWRFNFDELDPFPPVSCSEDLIRIIDSILANLGVESSAGNSFLIPEFVELETTGVL